MAAIVLDASAILNAFLPENPVQGAPDVLSLVRESGAVVAPIWPIEIANTIGSALRRGRVERGWADDALQQIAPAADQHSGFRLSDYAGQVLPLALRYGLSVYDASYLHVAQLRGLRLLTLDKRLRSAAQAENLAWS